MPPNILEGFFDDAVVVVEADLYRDELAELTAEEAALLPRAHPRRILEYRGGRHCARAALARLGAKGVSVLRAEDRSPVWPTGFVGSITHTRSGEQGFCAAAVARSTDARGVGIDAELDEPLEEKLWDRILVASELAFIDAAPETERGYLGKLVFSAKEATYKAQYAVTGQYLEFEDVRVELDPSRRAFAAALARDAGAFEAGFTFHGRYARRDGLIATGVLIR